MNSIIQKAPVLHQFVKLLQDKKHFDAKTTQQAKRVIADTIGVAYSGVKTTAFQSAIKAKSDFFGNGNLPIWGIEETCNLLGSVFYNALSVSSTDFDEGHRKAAGHPASIVVPVAIILGEYYNKPYRKILEAVIVGYEAGTRFSYARYPDKVDTYSTGRWGALATASTAAYLLNLNTEEFMHALSLAFVLSPAMQGGSTDVSTGSMSKEGVAWAAQSGLQSALLAQNGFVGPYLFIDEYDDIDYNKLIPSETENWLINTNYFKPYACCRWLHTAISITQELISAHHILSENIESIEVSIFSRALNLIESKYPENTIQAQFHLPFTMACQILFGKVTPDEVNDGNLSNQGIIDLIDKIVLIPDVHFDKVFPTHLGSGVSIKVKSENTFSQESTEAPWESSCPPSDEELFRKFENQLGENSKMQWEKYLQLD